jgi:glycosyltransferase involved in cell wall biosynthesis
MRTIRIGIFGRESAPADGGADTLLQMIAARLPASDGAIELVPVAWDQWSYRKQPLRQLRRRLAQSLGVEMPWVDLRPLCAGLRLDGAYFAAPAFAQIDVPFVFTHWDTGHRTIPEFPEMRRNGDSWTQREAMCRQMLPQASFVVVGNQTGADEVTQAYGVRADRVAQLPFPNPDFAGLAAAKPAWLPASPYFLYPAQFWPHKNHHTLIRALALLAKDQVDAALVFVGSDKGNTAYLQAVAADHGVAARVHFGGFVSRGELKALYENAAGLAFASLLGPNNLPPQEAAVLGCPMILSDLAGHREQLGAGALYAAPLEPAAWAAAMRRILHEAPLRPTLAGAARAAVAGCTPDAYAAGLGRLFSALAARRRLWA